MAGAYRRYLGSGKNPPNIDISFYPYFGRFGNVKIWLLNDTQLLKVHTVHVLLFCEFVPFSIISCLSSAISARIALISSRFWRRSGPL